MARRSAAKASPAPPYNLLLPFVVCVAASLLYVAPQEVPKVSMAAVKVLPILCLMWVILKKETIKGEVILLLLALVASLVGDYYLIWPDETFLEGVLAFWVTQALYIACLGFKRVSWRTALSVYGLSLTCLLWVLKSLPSPLLRTAVTFYGYTITTVLWRAIDRARLQKDVAWRRRACSVAGGAMFIVSDLCIVFLQLGRLLPHFPAQFIILSTYYTAQLLITLGMCEGFWKT